MTWVSGIGWPTRSQIVRHYEPPHHAPSDQGLCCVSPQICSLYSGKQNEQTLTDFVRWKHQSLTIKWSRILTFCYFVFEGFCFVYVLSLSLHSACTPTGSLCCFTAYLPLTCILHRSSYESYCDHLLLAYPAL